MRNPIYNCIELIATILQNDSDVNTITLMESEDSIDFDKKNIYNLVNINIVSANFETKTIGFEITALAQRDEVKTTITNKFLGNDNRLDNFASIHSILNNLTKKLRLTRNDFDIEFESATEPTIFNKAFTNGLDGMTLDLVLSYPDNDTTVCDGC
jgi:hypothetical protein